MALLLLSFSVPLPFPALGRGLFQPLPHFCLLASPLSSAFVLSPGRRTRERGQAWSSSPAAIHPALILSCSLPCFPTLATALSPFALELPAPQGGCRPCLLPPPAPPPAAAAPAAPLEAGQMAGPWGGHGARTRVLASGRTLALAAEPHWSGPALFPEIPGDRGQAPPPRGSCGLPRPSRLGN